MKATMDVKEVAEFLGISSRTILKHRAGMTNCPLLEGMPDPVMQKPKLVWWRKAIEDWVEKAASTSRVNDVGVEPTVPVVDVGIVMKRGRGRPRKILSAL